PDDKQALGSFMRNYGILSKDLAYKMRGNKLMLESGKLPAANVGSVNFDTGVTAYQLKDFATAATYLKAAKDAGYVDANNQLDAVLADAYKRSGNAGAALQMSKDEIAAAQALARQCHTSEYWRCGEATTAEDLARDLARERRGNENLATGHLARTDIGLATGTAGGSAQR
ncbi:MAG: hypothetical protein VW495_04865, partial [Rhodobiaceae bacterium]